MGAAAVQQQPQHEGLPRPWNDAITEWTGHLELRGLSMATVRVRRDHVRYVARRGGVESPARLTRTDLRAVFSQNWSAEHRKAMRASLRSFYEYCVSAELVSQDISDCLPAIRPPCPQPRPAPDAVWHAIAADAAPCELLMARLAAEAGLRRAEVAQVHTDDVITDLDGLSLVVHGKGGKQRIVPLTSELASALRAHSQSGYVFPGRTNGHLAPRTVGQKISALMPPGWSMHKLRHRFATQAYSKTGNLRGVQEVLGHASVATTQRYTAVSSREIRAVVEAASPSFQTDASTGIIT